MSLINALVTEDQEALELIASFESLISIGERLRAEDQSAVATELFLEAKANLMSRLGVEEQTSLESFDDVSILEASLEDVRETTLRLKEIMPKLNNEGRSECKQLLNRISHYDTTYLNAEWLAGKASVNTLVDLGPYNAVFTREGKVIDGVVSDVTQELEAYRESLAEVKALNEKFCATLSGILNEALGLEDDDVFVERLRSAVDELSTESTFPFTAWSRREHPWLGSDGEGNPASPTAFEGEQLMAVSLGDAQALAQAAVDYSKVYCEIVDNAVDQPCENVRGMLVQVEKRLKSLNFEVYTEFHEHFRFTGLRQDLTAPYSMMGTLVENTIRGIDAYLSESIVDKALVESE